jgi:hypothetical protein
MGLKITQVDAFTSQPFRGNPASVCILPQPGDGSWMQLVAREMNLSETAFLHRQNSGYGLRWFTPTVEVALCGHATLASAHVLWEQGLLSSGEQARFHTQSGLLTAGRAGKWIELDFPAVVEEPAASPSGLEEGLRVTAGYVGRNRFDYLVELESEEVVRSVKPDFGVLRRPGRSFWPDLERKSSVLSGKLGLRCSSSRQQALITLCSEWEGPHYGEHGPACPAKRVATCRWRIVDQAETAPTRAALSAVWLLSLIHAEMRLLAHTSPQKICRSRSGCVLSGWKGSTIRESLPA